MNQSENPESGRDYIEPKELSSNTEKQANSIFDLIKMDSGNKSINLDQFDAYLKQNEVPGEILDALAKKIENAIDQTTYNIESIDRLKNLIQKERMDSVDSVGESLENGSINSFLSQTTVEKYFNNGTEAVSVKMPSKPTGHENEEWEVRAIGIQGGVIARSKIEGEGGLIALLGESTTKIGAVKLFIKKNGEEKSWNMNISGESEVKSSEGEYSEKLKQMIQEVKSEQGYEGKLGKITGFLESDELSADIREELEDYFIDLVLNEIEDLRSRGKKAREIIDKLEYAKQATLRKEEENNNANNLLKKLEMSTFRLQDSLGEEFYREETENLKGVEKIYNIKEHSIYYPAESLCADQELSDTIEGLINSAYNYDIRKLRTTIMQLSGIFDNYVFVDNLRYSGFKKKYEELKERLNQLKPQ